MERGGHSMPGLRALVLAAAPTREGRSGQGAGREEPMAAEGGPFVLGRSREDASDSRCRTRTAPTRTRDIRRSHQELPYRIEPISLGLSVDVVGGLPGFCGVLHDRLRRILRET